MVHFWEYWRDIWEDDESGNLEKFLLVCEFPMTVARKVCVVGEVVFFSYDIWMEYPF